MNQLSVFSRAANRVLLSAIGLAFIYFLNSCAPCYYAPAAHNVPLLKEKKDFRASGGFKLGSYTWGCDFQGALAVTNHVGLLLNYSHFTGRESSFDNTKLTDSKGNTFEIGAGYYLPFKEHFVFETYGGYARSKIQSNHDSYLNYIESDVISQSFFIQPAIGMHTEHIELALSPRFRMLDFTKLQYNEHQNGEPDTDLKDLKNLQNLFLFEPAFTFRVGGETVKYQMQIGTAIPMGGSGYPQFDPLNLNFGIIFYVHGKKKSSEF
jgi:hypothetical protein